VYPSVEVNLDGLKGYVAEIFFRLGMPEAPARLAVELLCGGLSGGALGTELDSVDGDPATPYRCSQLFAAIDPLRFGISDLAERVTGFASLMPAPPRRRANGEWRPPPELVAKLQACAAKVGIERTLE
jgi:LDH2 family malate/lactate/ureidoglycolate dehydrogenase